EEKKITFDSSNETNPRFSSDGKKVYFARVEGDFGGGERPQAQIFVVPLEKIDKDPDDPENRPEPPNNTAEVIAEVRKSTPTNNPPPKEATIDWAGLKRRTRQVTRMPSSVFTYLPANDGRTIVFVASEGGGAGGGRGPGGGGGGGGPASIYSIQDDGKRLTRIATGGAT